MISALIGHTGFVGSNLLSQRNFDATFNSRNFRDMAGKRFDEVVCAGVSAVKWQANKEPQQDRRQIADLEEVLATVSANTFILISTIDVYPVLTGADERFDCHSMPNHAYGRHRLEFEDFVVGRFANSYVTRLPGLFGPGLKKNIIFDLLHNNRVETINPKSSFQFYDTRRLWSDIKLQIDANIRLLNLFTEPVLTSEIWNRFFPDMVIGTNPVPVCHYDLRTAHAVIRGRNQPYHYLREEVLDDIESYIRSFRKESKA